jgi:hypothetical protein
MHNYLLIIMKTAESNQETSYLAADCLFDPRDDSRRTSQLCEVHARHLIHVSARIAGGTRTNYFRAA